MPTITLKATDEFAAKLDQAADAAGESRSEYVRAAVEARIDPPVIGGTDRDPLAGVVSTEPVTGATPPDESPPVIKKGAAVGRGPAPTQPPPKAPTLTRPSPRAHHLTCTCYQCKPPK